MPVSAQDFDVAVIGGGPAGTATACRPARVGRRVVLFERDRFPRFHVGESLLASVHDALEEIGAADPVRAREVFVKWGATFGTGGGAVERFADFASSREVRAPQTWQMPRAEFDELLLPHVAECGAEVREAHQVLDVAFDPVGVTDSGQLRRFV
jgi:FAD-dependent halogenase